MATKKHNAPPGLDYSPITGVQDDLGFGIIQADPKCKETYTAVGAVFRRLYPVLKPDDATLPWEQPSCFRHEVLLPAGELWDAQRLARVYDDQGFSLKDLVVIVTLRFPEAEAVPQTMKLHEAWELARQFTRKRLVAVYGVAAICVMHVPARAARPGAPHVHVLMPARELLPSGFGRFARPLASDDGREIMDREWAAWRIEAAHG